MLRSLAIRNIVLAESLDIDFAPGFCVLTGETGAGKSILLDALGLALGNRAEARLLRHGEKQASVIAEFDISTNEAAKSMLAEQEIGADEGLLLRRLLYADGKSKAFVNDCPVSIQFLQNLSINLVEIHGQHEQTGLLKPSNHLRMLDSFASLDGQAEIVSHLFHDWSIARAELEKEKQIVEKARREEEFLRHALQELNDLNVSAGEEEQLAEQRTLMMNREKILETLNSAMAELNGQVDITSSLRSASRILERSALKTDCFELAIVALDKAIIEADDAVAALEKIAASMDMDVNAAERAEERLFSLRAAARKYSTSVDGLIEHRQEVARQLDLLDNNEKKLAELTSMVQEKGTYYYEQASELSEKRHEAAKLLEESIIKELAPLKMANSALKVEIAALAEEKWHAGGIDRVQFLVRTNPGIPFGPISKIASGGELSRFMLAFKVILTDAKTAPTLIFDEIDSGIGGAVADAVGARLARLGEQFQVLAVTHQPQVAAYGQHHLRVEKAESNGATRTMIETLSEQEKREEVARMLAGRTITEEARAAAGKLMVAE